MSIEVLLRWGVTLAALYCLIALSYQVLRTSSFGRRSEFAQPQGSKVKGVIYAFGQGMLPWEKESASKHLPTFFAGIFYHLGIFAALLLTVALLGRIQLSDAILITLRLIIAIGLANGVGLLVKRAAHSYMRFISCPDDYLANLLVAIFLSSAILTTFFAGLESIQLAVALILLLYIPLGKIKHCFFFFYSRIVFGNYFGRRGTLPHPLSEV